MNRSVPGVKIKTNVLSKVEIKESSVAKATTLMDVRPGPLTAPFQGTSYTNEAGSHKSFVANASHVAGPALHELALGVGTDRFEDADDAVDGRHSTCSGLLNETRGQAATIWPGSGSATPLPPSLSQPVRLAPPLIL